MDIEPPNATGPALACCKKSLNDRPKGKKNEALGGEAQVVHACAEMVAEEAVGSTGRILSVSSWCSTFAFRDCSVRVSTFIFSPISKRCRPLSIRRAFFLAYLGIINSMWKSISEKRQCSTKNRHNAQHNKHKSIRQGVLQNA